MLQICLLAVLCLGLCLGPSGAFRFAPRTAFRTLMHCAPAPAPAPASASCPPASTGIGEGLSEDPSFIFSPIGPVTLEEVSDENLIRIVNLETSDQQCNALLWKCLGYTMQEEGGVYSAEKVFPKWRERFESPPDLIGVQRVFDPAVDKPVRDASMSMMKSIPRDFKGGVRALEPLGFRGFKLKELTPNKTRRAQAVNWLIFYREKLFNKSFEQLRAERAAELKLREEADSQADPQAAEAALLQQGLPSERNYQKLRLD
jgi:hypothetical protein